MLYPLILLFHNPTNNEMIQNMNDGVPDCFPQPVELALRGMMSGSDSQSDAPESIPQV